MASLMRRAMENYKGRHCGCAPGTHAAFAEPIAANVEPAGAVPDIGAHAGALLLRLEDLGFTYLHGADLDVTRFDVPGAGFHKLELNEEFATRLNRTFYLVTSTDVIEHLDSPRHFLKQARLLLDEDG